LPTVNWLGWSSTKVNAMAYRQNRRVNGSALALARGLGWFSIGLGAAELLAPRTLAEQLGMWGREGLLRFYGARELAVGVAILASGDPAPWLWARVAGDVLDLTTLAAGLGGENPRQRNVAIALAAVAGVTALDGLSARALSTAAGEPAGAVRDYSDRRGMPKPPEAMRGAARNLHIPKDMRTPETLRPFASRSPAEQPAV
jgi:hypothetical protein